MENLESALVEIHHYLLKQKAIGDWKPRLRSGMSDRNLADFVVFFRNPEALWMMANLRRYAIALNTSSMSTQNNAYEVAKFINFITVNSERN